MRKVTILLPLVFLGLFLYLIWGKESDQFDEVAVGNLESESQFPLPGGAVSVAPLASPPPDHDNIYEDHELPHDDSDFFLDAEEVERMGHLFDEVDQRWSESIETLFIQELGLEAEIVQEYFQLREDFDEAKLAAYEQFHENLDPNESYHLTDFDEQVNYPIQREFEEKLHLLIGDNAMKAYLEKRDDFNRALKLDQETNLPLFLIDY